MTPRTLSMIVVLAWALAACEERTTTLPRPADLPSVGELDPECLGLGPLTTRESWPPPCYQPDYGTGYKLTLDEFRRLIRYPAYQDSTGALLRDWFGYEIRGIEDSAIVRSDSGEIVDLLALHEAIQSDPQKQYYFYQNAMALWR